MHLEESSVRVANLLVFRHLTPSTRGIQGYQSLLATFLFRMLYPEQSWTSMQYLFRTASFEKRGTPLQLHLETDLCINQ